MSDTFGHDMIVFVFVLVLVGPKRITELGTTIERVLTERRRHSK
jgi:Sec-independent protein translocase protein TatA